jgi:glycosyltransferase involved in cell wall biosynthesis
MPVTPFEKKEGELKLFFLSRISEKKNLLFALNILKKISLQGNQKITFDIYGPIEDNLYWTECLKIITELNSAHFKINYMGAVKGEFVNSMMMKYHFLFLPTLNENYGHAIVESFVNGKPVIISDQTPWRNLVLNNSGWDIALNNISKFENVIKDCLLMSGEEYKNMSKSAIQFSEKFCISEETPFKMNDMFEYVIKNG